MADPTPTEPSASIRERVMKAREIQQERYREIKEIHCNAQMNSRLLKRYAWPDSEGMAKLKERMTKLNMSARAFDRILRVARTIADLESACEIISSSPEKASLTLQEAASRPVLVRHIAEAISYRALDRGSYGSTFG